MNETFDTNAAIDDVARRFTAGDARADLRANVLSRLEERPSPTWWREPRVALATALVLVVAVGAAILLKREPPVAPVGPAVARVLPPETSPAPVAPPTLVTSEVQAAASPTQPSESELAWRARALPALALPAAITFEEIQPDTLAIPLLDVTPIVMPPIALPADGGGSR